jgi:hypothetical protein
MENIIKKIIGKKSDDENENESNDDEFNELSKEELNEILSEYIKLEKFLGVNLDDYLQGHKDVGDIQEKIIELFKQQKIMCCNDFFSFYCYTRGKTKDELKNRIHFLGINDRKIWSSSCSRNSSNQKKKYLSFIYFILKINQILTVLMIL